MDSDLERRLAALAEQPRWAPFARKLGEALAGIRRDFRGPARQKLERVVAETLERQLALADSRRRADAALRDLEARQAELQGALWEILLRMVPDDGATRH